MFAIFEKRYTHEGTLKQIRITACGYKTKQAAIKDLERVYQYTPYDYDHKYTSMWHRGHNEACILNLSTKRDSEFYRQIKDGTHPLYKSIGK